MPLLTPLPPDERTHFVVIALDDDTLRALATSLGTAPRGYRIEKLSPWDLALSLLDHYDVDDEVAHTMDATLTEALGPSPLTDALTTSAAADAVQTLLLDSPDPLRDLTWAFLHLPADIAAERAATVAKAIVDDFDAAEAQADEAQPAAPAPARQVERALRLAGKETQKAQSGRERAEQRLDQRKLQLSDLEARIATARRELRDSEKLRRQLATERDRLQRERDTLRTKLQSGTAAEVERLQTALDAAARREQHLITARDDARAAAAEADARARLPERPTPTAQPADVPEPTTTLTTWSVPIFTPEFYDSLRGFDRRIVRATFEKIHRLCEDWRHPSLRAIPLEGLPECYRIRIALDVRLIYRPLDGGRLEILSVIDRTDLPRYIRNARG